MSDLFDELGATEKVTYKERGTESVKQRNRKRRRTAILSFFTVMIVSAAAVIVSCLSFSPRTRRCTIIPDRVPVR